jgi:NAD(P)-dependent dehydrogenase (short-subunit alcohol dehydrogenase family)
MDLALKGRAAVVTGGAGQGAGLGQGLVRRLAESGMQVAILDIDGGAASRLAAEISDEGGEAMAIEADITSVESLQSAAAKVESAFGACNVLCAHVGGGGQGRFEDLPLEAWRQAMDLMVTGTVATVQAFLPLMRRTDGLRRIVLTSSVAALAPGRFQGPYRAAKAAVMSIGETLDLELSPEGIGTTVVFPSGMLPPELMELARGVMGAPSDPGNIEMGNIEMSITKEMITDPSDLAEGDQAANPVVEALTSGRRFVVTHGRTAEATYRARHDLLTEAFAELAGRSYHPSGGEDAGR